MAYALTQRGHRPSQSVVDHTDSEIVSSTTVYSHFKVSICMHACDLMIKI